MFAFSGAKVLIINELRKFLANYFTKIYNKKIQPAKTDWILSIRVFKKLHLDLYLNTRRKLELHKCIDSLCCRTVDVDKALEV